MYNEERKQAFIKSYTKSINVANAAVYTFRAFQPYEEAYKKDLSSLTLEELQPAIDKILCLKSESKLSQLILLREYVRWCGANHMPDVTDSIMRVDISGINKMREQMVSGPLQLQNYFNQVFTPEKEETMDNIYRCWMWMGFAGMREKDTLEVLDTDVDFSEMVIRFHGEEYPIYKEAIPAFKNAVRLTAFRYIHPNYTDKTVIRDRVPGHLLLRGIKANVKIMTVRSVISKHLSNCNKTGRSEKNLSFYRIALSGIFYRVYEKERAGIPPDFSEYVLRDTAGKEYSLKSGVKLQSVLNSREREYMKNYQRWKIAFSI